METQKANGTSSALVAERRFKFNGQEYPLTPPDLGTEAQYVKHLEEDAIAGVRRNRAAYAEDYFPTLEAVTAKVGLKLYEWGGQLWLQSLFTVAGMQELCFLSFRQAVPHMEREHFEALWKEENEQTDRGVVNRIGEAMWELLKRPNSGSPVKPA